MNSFSVTLFQQMTFKYHVTCVAQKKVISINRKDEIYSEIKRVFRVSSVSALQYYDDEWKDWVDISTTSELPDKGRLQVTIEIPSETIQVETISITRYVISNLS